MATFTIKYPVEIGSHSGLARDYTSQSRIRLISTVVKRQFVARPGYGCPPFAFEQGSLEPDAEQLMVQFFTKAALQKFIPSIGVIATESTKEAPRRRILRILFIDRASGADPRKPQILPIGFDLGEGT